MTYTPFVSFEQVLFDVFEISRHCLLKGSYHLAVLGQKLSSTWSAGQVVDPGSDQTFIDFLNYKKKTLPTHQVQPNIVVINDTI